MQRRAEGSNAARLPPGFAITRREAEQRVIALAVSGELDATTAPLLREQVEQLVAEEHRGVVVDLTEVTFIDSVSLAALVAARRRMGESGRLALVADGAFVLLVLEATGLDAILDVFPTFEEARAFVLA